MRWIRVFALPFVTGDLFDAQPIIATIDTTTLLIAGRKIVTVDIPAVKKRNPADYLPPVSHILAVEPLARSTTYGIALDDAQMT